MSAPDILQRFLEHLQDLSDQTGYPVAWPNVSFTPPTGPFYRVSLLPAETEVRALKGSASRRLGVLQVDVVWPAGAGATQPWEAAHAVVTHFARGTRFHDPRVEIVRSPWINPAQQSADRYMLPVTIPYEAVT